VFGDLTDLAKALDGSVFTKDVEKVLGGMVSSFLRIGSYRLMFGKFGVVPLLASAGVSGAATIGQQISKGTPHASLAY